MYKKLNLNISMQASLEKYQYNYLNKFLFKYYTNKHNMLITNLIDKYKSSLLDMRRNNVIYNSII